MKLGSIVLGAAVVGIAGLAAGTGSQGEGAADAGSAPVVPVVRASAIPPLPAGPPVRAELVQRAPVDAGPPSSASADPPGILRGSVDGGSEPGAASGAGRPAGLEEQVTALRARIAALEQRADSDRAQAQQLQEMNAQLRALNQQAADAQARRAASEEQAVALKAQRQDAIDGLGSALSLLSRGGDDVASALDAGDAAFPPQARLELAAARAAIENKNLGEARAHLEAAIGHARAGR